MRGLPDRLVALAVFLSIAVLLVATAAHIGLTWDEPIYIVSSSSYSRWLGELVRHPAQALRASVIQQYWEINHEHPPLDKIWSGLVYATGVSRVIGDLTARRFGNILLSAGLAALLYLMMAEGRWAQGREYGRVAGLAAVAALMSMPRFFFHAHLAALDVPTAAVMFLVCYLFWRTAGLPGMRWSLALGIPFGLAMATKVNAPVELPVILGLWVLIFRRRQYLFLRLIVMGLVGAGVWFLLWPWLYHDTYNRMRAYIDFMTRNHLAIGQWFRGHLFLSPPWYFPFVMTLAVLPLTLIVLSALGFLRAIRTGRSGALGWLLILGGLVPLVALAVGRSMVFDNGRLWMPSYPFIAALAGLGFAEVWQGIQHLVEKKGWRAWKRPLFVSAVILFFVPQVLVAARIYPHLLSYYSEGIGGLPGAVRLGFENTYWAETYSEALEYLNTNAPHGAVIWVEAHDVMLYYQSLGRLRADLKIASPHGVEGIVPGETGFTIPIQDADYAVIEYRQSGFFTEMLQWIHQHQKVYQVKIEGVPVLAIYKR